MQLGNILSSSPGEPCAIKEVEFHVMRMTAQGRQRHRVKAALLPVSEADRQAARKDALLYLRTLPEYAEREGYAPPIPPNVLDNEALLKFLCYALHVSGSSLVRLVSASDYLAFRSGVVLEQILWLNKTYEKFIDDEYPELAPDLPGLEEQAEKK